MTTTCGQNFRSIVRFFLELLSPNLTPIPPKKWIQLGPEPKKRLFVLGEVDNNKYPETET